MREKNGEIGESYYRLVGEKNIDAIGKFLDAHVELLSPLATVKGKEEVVRATANFMKSFDSLRIKAKFGNDEQAMIVYDTDIPGIANNFPGASLLSIRDGLITRIQLFYDGSRFMVKSKEIFN